ncbi:hypothetical protein [Mesorhizobium sp. M0895]|uniref:hypothetical protein n=1 Tax=Mesorhizobium sp. M0895 TaxID=2957019 RepID=UPI00333A1637
MLGALQRDFGDASAKSAKSRCLERRPTYGNATASGNDQTAARNQAWQICDRGAEGSDRRSPSASRQDTPVFVFHVNLRLHRGDTGSVEDRREPVCVSFVSRAPDRGECLIAGDAVRRRQINAGQPVGRHRADRVVLAKCRADDGRQIGTEFAFLRGWRIVERLESAERRVVFRVLDDRHQLSLLKPVFWLPS